MPKYWRGGKDTFCDHCLDSKICNARTFFSASYSMTSVLHAVLRLSLLLLGCVAAPIPYATKMSEYKVKTFFCYTAFAKHNREHV